MAVDRLQDDLVKAIRGKLEEVCQKAEALLNSKNKKEGNQLGKIAEIKNIAVELDRLAMFYHFTASLPTDIEGREEIAKALAALSKKRHGALIAVEQRDNLEALITACTTTGSLIGAAISAPLLETIFYPGTPLHDGAVIIRKGRIVSAGCVFPLSEKEYVGETKIGTRHRAAMGLSEKTDAIVFIVSAETGTVSFVYGGILHSIEFTSRTKA
jgi:uncharacterized protein (TIGR00159 family)